MDTRKRWGVEGILRLGLFLWLVVAIGTVTAKGQVETTSRINGTVSDPSGAVVPGATVTVKNEGTGATREATTDAGGSYSFPSLPPGTYAITVSQSGFKKAEVTGRVIQVAQPAQVDLTLQLGTTSETITVSGAGAELISTTSAEVSGTVNSTLVTEIPLKRQNFFELLALIPGTTRQDLNISSLSFVGQALNFVQAGNTFTASGIFVAGNRDNATNVSVDGANVQSSVYQQTIQLQSPASVQEMRVESASMSAEFGGGAAAVNVITKSGTGTYHGELYEFFRNNHLDAAPFFTNLAGEKLPNYQQNQFGAALGGPIRKEKLLFFGNYEGFRVRESSVSFEQVPSGDVVNGDFSTYFPEGGSGPAPTIYNPYSFDPATGLRQPFPGNKIPLGSTSLCSPRPTCVDPVALAFLQNYVSLPNITLNGIPMLDGAARSVLNSNQYNFRVDFIKSAKATFYGRFTSVSSPQFSGGIQPLEGTTNPYSSKNFVLHWTEVMKPTLVNDLMIAYTRPNWRLGRDTSHGNVAQQIGLQNVGNAPGAPIFQVPGYSLDVPNYYLFDARENNYQLKDDLSYVKGRHNFKFGVEIRNRRFYYDSTSFDQGIFDFGTVFSVACPAGNEVCEAARAAAGLERGGSPLADYLLGALRTGTVVLNAPYTGYQNYYGLYAQDSWRATPKLTVNYGLRYEDWTPWLVPRNITHQWDGVNGENIYALQNPLDWLDPTKCFGACAPLNPGVPRQGYKTGNLDFAPRLGVTYAITPRTVLKAAAGIYYDGNSNNNQFHDMQVGVGPFSQRASLDNSADQQLPTYFVSGSFPPPSPTGIPQPNSSPPTAFRGLQAYFPTAAVYQWSFTVQRSLSQYWSLELDYLGSHTIHEYMFEDMNAARLPQGPYADMSVQERRIFPQWGRVTGWIPTGWAKYNALTVSLTNREWHGLTWISNFTWAKDLAITHISGSDSALATPFCRYCLSGDAQWVPKKRFVAGYNYRLPFGRGKPFAGSLRPVLDKVVSGWAFSGNTDFSTGSPEIIWAANDLTGTALWGYPAPNRVCDPRNVPGGRSRLEWFNTTCFVDAPFGTWPNSPFGAVTYPGINNWDLSLTKTTATGLPKDTGRLEFRADFFNAFNHTQWGNPDKWFYEGSPTFGQIYSTRPARIIQFALRYFF